MTLIDLLRINLYTRKASALYNSYIFFSLVILLLRFPNSLVLIVKPCSLFFEWLVSFAYFIDLFLPVPSLFVLPLAMTDALVKLIIRIDFFTNFGEKVNRLSNEI